MSGALPGQSNDYPLIATLGTSDLLYRQIQDDVQSFHYAQAHPDTETLPPLALFRYRPRDTESLGIVAARLGVGQATLATLNRAATPLEFASLGEVIVSNIPGLFIPDADRTEFERDLAAARSARSQGYQSLTILSDGGQIRGRFYPGDDFTAHELAAFHRGYFHAPVVTGSISSRFGVRQDPLGPGTALHTGIDIVAPVGTPVFAARSGTVTRAGRDARYGNYVIVAHAGSYQTLYAHLQTISVRLRDEVESGSIIGTVGDTGLTTGAHLHFEIRWKGAPVDPLLHLPQEWRRR